MNVAANTVVEAYPYATFENQIGSAFIPGITVNHERSYPPAS